MTDSITPCWNPLEFSRKCIALPLNEWILGMLRIWNTDRSQRWLFRRRRESETGRRDVKEFTGSSDSNARAAVQ